MTNPFFSKEPIAVTVINGTIDGGGGSGSMRFISGEGAPDGSVGMPGDVYLDTLNGDLYTNKNGTYELELNLIGPKGDAGSAGTRGSRIWSTTGITGTSTTGTVFEDSGISGALIYDYALNRSTGNLYVCSKAGDADVAEWKYDSNIKGPAGNDGTDGADGAPGQDGEPGADGADGFPTEAQWNALVDRVQALEDAAAGAE